MITLDQVMLLEQKVESAVAKIQQLQAENDALRTKCQELTNALSSKTEQLSSIETDQNQIESGIKKALDRLMYIENAVLKSGNSNAANLQAPSIPQGPAENIVETPIPAAEQEIIEEDAVEEEVEDNQFSEESSEIEEPVSYVQYNQPIQNPVEPQMPVREADPIPNFDSMQPTEDDGIEDAFDDSEDDQSQDNLGFDIF
ncbi:MAG: cell division protein ZapB [Treponema sp.]|nr:cell division protein ZapB [Treponema sp.]